MATGFKFGNYITDAGDTLVVRVEADRFAAGDFAWVASTAGEVQTGYGAVKPRKVYGRETTTGKRASAIVPDIGSDIWNGTAASFLMKDDDGVSHTMQVTGFAAERSHRAHA